MFSVLRNWSQVPRKIMQTNAPSTLFQLAIVCLHYRVHTGLGFLYLGFCSSKICTSHPLSSPTFPFFDTDSRSRPTRTAQTSALLSQHATPATLTARSRSTKQSTRAV
jgi:hypothetical protein